MPYNHPLYNLMMNGYGSQPQQQIPAMSGGPRFQNPIQKMNYIMQAMRNPADFVKRNLPGIPEEAFNDPTGNRVLQYMQQNMGVTRQDIQNAASQIPNF